VGDHIQYIILDCTPHLTTSTEQQVLPILLKDKIGRLVGLINSLTGHIHNTLYHVIVR